MCSADAAAEVARLTKELSDTKKKFLALAKKKSAEHAAALKVRVRVRVAHAFA